MRPLSAKETLHLCGGRLSEAFEQLEELGTELSIAADVLDSARLKDIARTLASAHATSMQVARVLADVAERLDSKRLEKQVKRLRDIASLVEAAATNLESMTRAGELAAVEETPQ